MRSIFEVRDYECDMQGIVNNANYFHYLEHSRHEFFNKHNIDFQQAHESGFDLVVSNIEAKFIKSLKPRDKFEVRSSFLKEGRIRYICEQEIWRLGNSLRDSLGDSASSKIDNPELILKAKTTCACIDLKRGRPVNYPPLDEILTGLKDH